MCILEPDETPVPQLAQQAPRSQLGNLLSAFDEILALDDPDAILRRAVEVAHKRVGLDRAAIFLIDRDRNLMLGTWGSDLRGGIVDERHIMYEVSHTDREAIRRSEVDGAHFTVFNNCPISAATATDAPRSRADSATTGMTAPVPSRTVRTTLELRADWIVKVSFGPPLCPHEARSAARPRAAAAIPRRRDVVVAADCSPISGCPRREQRW